MLQNNKVLHVNPHQKNKEQLVTSMGNESENEDENDEDEMEMTVDVESGGISVPISVFDELVVNGPSSIALSNVRKRGRSGTVRRDSYNQATMSGMCMGGYKSALKWWYKENNVVMDAETDSWLDSFILGYKKLVQDKKQRGIMSMTEGKAPLSYAGYIAISQHMMTMKPEGNKNPWNEGLFAWAFMVLSWNYQKMWEN